MSNEKSCPCGQTFFQLEISGGFILLMTTSAFFGGGTMTAAAAIAACTHELGHLAVILRQGSVPRRLRLDASGASLYCIGPEPGIRQELLRAAAGPAAGALLWLLLLPSPSGFLRSVGEMSLMLSLTNLLPVRGLDGGRILNCLCGEAASPLAYYLPDLLSILLTLLLGLRFSPQLFLYGLWLLLRLPGHRSMIDFPG